MYPTWRFEGLEQVGTAPVSRSSTYQGVIFSANYHPSHACHYQRTDLPPTRRCTMLVDLVHTHTSDNLRLDGFLRRPATTGSSRFGIDVAIYCQLGTSIQKFLILSSMVGRTRRCPSPSRLNFFFEGFATLKYDIASCALTTQGVSLLCLVDSHENDVFFRCLVCNSRWYVVVASPLYCFS